MVKQVRVEELANAYRTGVSAKAQKWYDHFQATTGIADAARSETAESNYNAKMQVVLSNKLRQKGLAGVTDQDIKAAVTSPSIYSTPAQNKAPKFQRKFAPYAAVINSVLPTLGARGADPEANVDNRVKPLVRALHAKKISGT